jgi:hypothetical protein
LNHPAIIDLVSGFLWVICLISLTAFDISMIYHHVRNQALIKLYVIFNMLDIADKLCTSMGQDAITTIHRTFSTRFLPLSAKSSTGVLMMNAGTYASSVHALVVDFAIAAMYVLAHAAVKLVQVITLHVAINTSDTGLLVILITTNFVEIKGAVSSLSFFPSFHPSLAYHQSTPHIHLLKIFYCLLP